MTVPTRTALELPRTGLGAALGQGLQQGTQQGLQALLQNFLSAKQPGLTAFQQISTEQREKERKRKTSNAVLSQLNSLADLKKGVLLPADVPSVAAKVNESIEGGEDPIKALQSGVFDYGQQRLALGELDIPKFKAKNAENLRKDVINSLTENNITNPSIIGRALKKQKWTSKEIQNVVRSVRKGLETVSKGKVKFNPQNPEHIKRRNEILAKTKGNRQQAQQILAREFE
jgi:hypothetical protein